MTYSPNGARQPGRHDLSAKPGEGFGAWSERVRRVAVIDPELAGQERRRIEAEDQRRREAAEQSRRRAITGLRLVLGCMAALAVSALLYVVTGLTGWIVVVCSLATAASLPAYLLATRPGRSAAAMAAPGPVPGLHQAVLLTELDEPSRKLLAREQQAIDEVISSEIYRGHEPARWALEAQLRRIEWQSATRLRTLTLRQAQHDAIPVLGGKTADVLDRQQPHLTAAEDATVAEVQAIEALAARARRAELERRDQENAIKASRLDGSYQDLGASVAAAELAIEEIGGLADSIAPPDEAEPT
jgi:sulfopyruvate decarboxylase TPP-binding subunit